MNYYIFFRIFKLGWREFSRNLGVSLGTIFVMVIALLLLGGVFLVKEVGENLITFLKEKVDVSVYFKEEAKEEEILKLKERLENFPEIKAVEYISKEKALEVFKEKRKDDPTFIEALGELEENPLLASLNITAAEIDDYEKIANFLEKGESGNLIERITMKEARGVIDKLSSLFRGIKLIGAVISIVLILFSAFVTFNTIILAIHAKKEEISTMKLIGATNWFIRSPFLVQGLLIGIFAGIISMLIFYGINIAFPIEDIEIFRVFKILDIFRENIFIFFLTHIGGGILLGFLSSFLAVQRHLRV